MKKNTRPLMLLFFSTFQKIIRTVFSCVFSSTNLLQAISKWKIPLDIALFYFISMTDYWKECSIRSHPRATTSRSILLWHITSSPVMVRTSQVCKLAGSSPISMCSLCFSSHSKNACIYISRVSRITHLHVKSFILSVLFCHLSLSLYINLSFFSAFNLMLQVGISP